MLLVVDSSVLRCVDVLYPCREAIDRITEELLEKETLSGDDMRTILAQYTTIPEENLKAAREQEEAKEAVMA
jgi:cell division protease FtsH